jgi:hypothetical protein
MSVILEYYTQTTQHRAVFDDITHDELVQQLGKAINSDSAWYHEVEPTESAQRITLIIPCDKLISVRVITVPDGGLSVPVNAGKLVDTTGQRIR